MKPRSLSPRERQILELSAAGLPRKAIASQLGITENTAKHYAQNVLRKTGASSSVQAWNILITSECRAAVDDAIAALQMLKPGEASKKTALKILGLLAVRLSQYSTAVPDSGTRSGRNHGSVITPTPGKESISPKSKKTGYQTDRGRA